MRKAGKEAERPDEGAKRTEALSRDWSSGSTESKKLACGSWIRDKGDP